MKNIVFSLFLCSCLRGQTILNGSFENNNASSDQINLSNDACNKMLRDVNSFGTYGDVDIINSSTYGNSGAQHGKWYIGITGGGTDIIAMTLSTQLITGQTYSLSYYDRKTSGYNVYPLQIGLSNSNNSMGTIVYTSAEAATLNTWTAHTFTFVAPNSGRYLTVKMSAGSISDWVNIDNFVLHPSRCPGEIKIQTSSGNIESGSIVNFTVLCNASYTWDSAIPASKGGNIYSASPTETTVYKVTSAAGNCPAVSATVAVNVIQTKTVEAGDTAITKKTGEKKKEDITKTARHKKLFGRHRVNGRKFNIQESVTVSTSDIKLLVWDKNKVDGDMISLYLNGELIEKEFAVSKSKKEITLNLAPGKNVIVMYAINLGTIPPNTAIMSINNGARPKLITLVSDLKKSGALEIIYDPVAVFVK